MHIRRSCSFGVQHSNTHMGRAAGVNQHIPSASTVYMIRLRIDVSHPFADNRRVVALAASNHRGTVGMRPWKLQRCRGEVRSKENATYKLWARIFGGSSCA
jgi:hypothetical protein